MQSEAKVLSEVEEFVHVQVMTDNGQQLSTDSPFSRSSSRLGAAFRALRMHSETATFIRTHLSHRNEKIRVTRPVERRPTRAKSLHALAILVRFITIIESNEQSHLKMVKVRECMHSHIIALALPYSVAHFLRILEKSGKYGQTPLPLICADALMILCMNLIFID